MLAAIIFDMDGLLIDSEPLWVRAECEVFAAANVRLEPQDCGQTKGLRIDEVLRHWHRARGFDCDLSIVEERLIARVIELVTTEGEGLPGIQRAVRDAGKVAKIALASSSPLPIIEAALTRLGLHFDVIVSAQNETHGKPHPAIFLRTADRLGVEATDCLVLEDSLNGVIAAKAARMRCIAIPRDEDVHDPRFAIADRIVASLDEIAFSEM